MSSQTPNIALTQTVPQTSNQQQSVSNSAVSQSNVPTLPLRNQSGIPSQQPAPPNADVVAQHTSQATFSTPNSGTSNLCVPLQTTQTTQRSDTNTQTARRANNQSLGDDASNHGISGVSQPPFGISTKNAKTKDSKVGSDAARALSMRTAAELVRTGVLPASAFRKDDQPVIKGIVNKKTAWSASSKDKNFVNQVKLSQETLQSAVNNLAVCARRITLQSDFDGKLQPNKNDLDAGQGFGFTLFDQRSRTGTEQFWDPIHLRDLNKASGGLSEEDQKKFVSEKRQEFSDSFMRASNEDLKIVQVAGTGSDAVNLCPDIARICGRKRCDDPNANPRMAYLSGTYGGGRGYSQAMKNTDGYDLEMRLALDEDLKIDSPTIDVWPASNLSSEQVKDVASREEKALAHIRKLCSQTLTKNGNKVEPLGAIFLEPIQGANGVKFYRPEFLQQLRQLADEFHVPIICDEVLLAGGRTGTFFGYQQYNGFKPDFVTFGKACQVCGLAMIDRGTTQNECQKLTQQEINEYGANMDNRIPVSRYIRGTQFADSIVAKDKSGHNAMDRAVETGQVFGKLCKDKQFKAHGVGLLWQINRKQLGNLKHLKSAEASVVNMRIMLPMDVTTEQLVAAFGSGLKDPTRLEWQPLTPRSKQATQFQKSNKLYSQVLASAVVSVLSGAIRSNQLADGLRNDVESLVRSVTGLECNALGSLSIAQLNTAMNRLASLDPTRPVNKDAPTLSQKWQSALGKNKTQARKWAESLHDAQAAMLYGVKQQDIPRLKSQQLNGINKIKSKLQSTTSMENMRYTNSARLIDPTSRQYSDDEYLHQINQLGLQTTGWLNQNEFRQQLMQSYQSEVRKAAGLGEDFAFIQFATHGDDILNLLPDYARSAGRDGNKLDRRNPLLLTFSGTAGGSIGISSRFGDARSQRHAKRVTHGRLDCPTVPVGASLTKQQEAALQVKEQEALAKLERQLKSKVDGEQAGGILLSPVTFDEDGMRMYRDEFLIAVRKLADAAKVPIFMDERDTNGGRLGTFFGYQLYKDFQPDYVVIDGGMRVAALGHIKRTRVWNSKENDWNGHQSKGQRQKSRDTERFMSTTQRYDSQQIAYAHATLKGLSNSNTKNVEKFGGDVVKGLNQLLEKDAKPCRGKGYLITVADPTLRRAIKDVLGLDHEPTRLTPTLDIDKKVIEKFLKEVKKQYNKLKNAKP